MLGFFSMQPRAAMFDLDDTLAESFQCPSDEMLEKLTRLLDKMPVAIVTGAGFPRMQEQFLSVLEKAPRIDRFYLFPTSGAQCYVFEGVEWRQNYSLSLTEAERSRIKETIERVVQDNAAFHDIENHGLRMIDREAQVAFTLVGVEAPLEIKQTWDVDGTKRRLLRDTLLRELPEFEIRLGGTTTVDVTRKGVNKAYAVEWLSKKLEIPTAEMLYIGDALFEGGNDEVVISTGIETRGVSGPDETLGILNELLAERE